MSIEAMKKALDAIETYGFDYMHGMPKKHYTELLRKAIEAAKQREWVGLTDDEIVGMTCACIDDGTFNMNCARDFARAIETKLKEQNT